MGKKKKDRGKDGNNLTEKQEEFCFQYLIDFNATKAAIRAGYSKRTARQQGYENLKKPDIQRKISELKNERKEKYEITVEKTLREAAKIAYSNLREFLDFSGKEGLVSIEKLKKLHPDEFSCIQEIEKNPTLFGDKLKIKLFPKMQGIDLLFDYLGLKRNEGDSGGLDDEEIERYKDITEIVKRRDEE